MDRSDRIGLGVAIAGHVVLFGLLSLGFLAPTPPPVPVTPAIEVSMVKEVALEATAPQAVTPPAQSVAPETGEPQDAAPPAPAEAEPEPVPAPAPPAPAPPAPAPKPQAKPAPKPAPAPKPVPKPQPKTKPPEPAAEKAASKPAPKPAKPVQTAAPTPAKPTKSTSQAPAKPTKSTSAASTVAKTPPAKAKGTGATQTATAAKPRGSRLGPNFLEGLSDQPTESKSQTPRAAKIDGRALAAIIQAIKRQIQPCADRQVTTGMPGASDIMTTLNLKLNEDGTLSANPTVVRQTGITDENQRYARRVVDLGIAALKGCSPLKLPPEFYSTPNGGWNNINYNWNVR